MDNNEVEIVRTKVKELIDDLEPHQFKTGSRGYLLQSRETMNTKKFMVNIQVIEVGSKPAG